jgi:hypothetical protein
MLSTTLILSCNTINQALVCKQIKKHAIPLSPKCSPSWKFDRCRCRCFDYNKWETVDLNKCERFSGFSSGETEYDFELDYCEGVDGSFLADEAVNIRPNVKALHALKGNLCDN